MGRRERREGKYQPASYHRRPPHLSRLIHTRHRHRHHFSSSQKCRRLSRQPQTIASITLRPFFPVPTREISHEGA